MTKAILYVIIQTIKINTERCRIMHRNVFDIDKLADTAMLSLTDAEKEKLTHDVDKLIMFANKIKDFEFDEVKYGKRGPKNVFREDAVGACTDRNELIFSDKITSDGYISVPIVIGGEE